MSELSELSQRRPRILFLADLPPWPLHGGGQIKSYLTLRALSEIAEIHLVTFLRRPEDEAHLEELRPFCVTIQAFPLPRSLWRDAAAGAWSLLTNESFLMQRNHTAEMTEYVRDVLSSGDFDVIHADHLQMMQFVPDEVGVAKIVLDCHNVEHDLVHQTGEAVGEWADIYLRPLYFREAARLKDVEAEACRRADLILAVTDSDAAKFRELAPENADRVAVVPIGVDTEYFAPVSRRYVGSRTLLFLGTLFWPPNVDALRWFCDDILPRIQNYIPDVRLLVVGSRPSRDVKDIAMATPAVELIADAPDIRPYAARASAFVAPLRFGGGMRVKTLCAMAMNLPVVATGQGVAGISLRDAENSLILPKNSSNEDKNSFLFGGNGLLLAKREGKIGRNQIILTENETIPIKNEIILDRNEGDIDDFALPFTDFALIADDADAFAAAVVRVLADRELAEALARNGRNLVKNAYSTDVIAARLQSVYRERVL